MAEDLGSLLGGALDPYQAALRKAQANTKAIAARRKYEQGIEPEMTLADAFTMAPPGLRPEEMTTPPDESWRSAAGRRAGQGISALTGKAPSEASQDVQTGLALTDFLPLVGDAQGYGDVYDDAKAGDWTSAAMDLAAAILPIVPSGVGRLKRKAKSGEATRAIDEALGNTPDLGAGLPPVRAYHSASEPFDEYDWSRLGRTTLPNVEGQGNEEWAMNLARLGPWASETPLGARMGGVDLDVDIGGKGKEFGSLDDLETAVREAGGPDQFRDVMLRSGYGHIKVKDEEFGTNSFIALAPEHFKRSTPTASAADDLAKATVPPAAPQIMKRGTGEKTPYSNLVRRPLDEMTFKTAPSTKQPPLAAEKSFKFEDVPDDSVFVKFLGDRSPGGQVLTEVDGKKLPNTVEQEGGIDYMRRPDGYWGSKKGIITGIKGQIDELLQSGKPVFGASVGMGEQAIDFATMPINTALELIKLNPLSDKAKSTIDDLMKANWGKPDKNGKYEYPAVANFPGMDGITPEWIAANPVARKKLTKLLDKKVISDLGGPDMGAVRKANTDPRQLRDPMGTTGRRIVRAGPEEVQHITDPKIPHETYASQLAGGEYAGDTEGFALDEFWSDWMKTRPEGETMDRTMYTFGRQPVVQRATPEWKDKMMKLREYKLSKEGQKLGLAGAIGAGLITAGEAKDLFGYDES